MKYIDVKEAARIWGISDRRIRFLCNEGRIDGAIKTGWSWTIPADTPKPRDGRVLRHYRNLDIRPGAIDVQGLKELSEKDPINEGMLESPSFNAMIAHTLCFLLEKEGIVLTLEEIAEILSGRIVQSLSLEIHLLVLNFRSSMLSLARNAEEWTDKSMRMLSGRMLQGIDDWDAEKWRDGYADQEVRGKEKLPVDVQMETFFVQYESWKNMHPLVSGVLLYGEMLRIRPFEKYSSLISYLVCAGEMMRGGLLPPSFRAGDEEDFDASYFIALKRGNYKDFTSYIEERVLASYSEVF